MPNAEKLAQATLKFLYKRPVVRQPSPVQHIRQKTEQPVSIANIWPTDKDVSVERRIATEQRQLVN